MFRTRDFVLLFVTIAFLLVAIVSTVWKQNLALEDSQPTIKLAESEVVDYQVEVVSKDTLDRDARLKEMRRKIAEDGAVFISKSTYEEDVTEATNTTTEELEVTAGIIKCADYYEYNEGWPATSLRQEVAEGARVFYLEYESEGGETSSSSQTVREVLLQLPLNPVKSQTPSCISTDVIGVAQDGSLIRNNDSSLYSVFDDRTLIGYALDGYPIYGQGVSETDVCGGIDELGGYRYVITESSEHIIDCFLATPVRI